MNRRRFLAISAAAAIATPARAETMRWRGMALGADAEITLRGPKQDADRALTAARRAMEEVEALFSLYRPESALSRLNRDGALEAPPLFQEMITLSDRLHEVTAGRFDPTVQPLWRALATGGDVAAARRLVGWRKVRGGARVRLAPGQALTFNGIAQGFATDRVSTALAAEGFGETLVNIGEFRAGGGDWRIGVADANGALLTTVPLSGRAVATSSPGAMMIGGASHILSPGAPYQPPRWTTVSVEAESAALADGLSTALCHVSAEKALRIARDAGGVRALILVDAEGFRRYVL